LLLLDPEEPLINQGETGENFYFIKEGDLEVFILDPVDKKDVYVKTLKNGEFFGEYALITK